MRLPWPGNIGGGGNTVLPSKSVLLCSLDLEPAVPSLTWWLLGFPTQVSIRLTGPGPAGVS